MDVTKITADNAEYFEDLVPGGSFEDGNLFWLGAIAEDGTACSVLGVSVYGETAYIDWIYTHPDHRREKAAKTLLKSLRELLHKINVEILEISFSDRDEDLEEFLEDAGFLIAEDGDSYSVPLSELIYSETIERMQEDRKSESRVIRAAELRDINVLYRYLEKNDIPFSGNREISYGHSLLRLDKTGAVTGCMLVVNTGDKDLIIPYLINDGSMEGLTDLFLGMRDLVIENGWAEGNIIFTDISGEMTVFVESITGEEPDEFLLKGQKQGVRILSK